MKKLAFLLIFGIMMVGTSYAQIKLGIRGGLNFDKVKMIEQPDNYKLVYDNGMGFHFGLTSQIEVLGLFVQPELLFSTLTNDVTLDDLSASGVDKIGKQRFNKVDVPVLAGVKFGTLKLGAGPVFTKIVSSKSQVLDENVRRSATVGYQLGAGFDFDKFNIELRYEGNLSKYGTGVKIGTSTYDFDHRMNQLILSTALYF
ncbi:MAG: PorT family protein [Bacteroidales bacterium]|nr:PorT family protein [Bacteroidales bacterium]MBN2819463.1 PorT family protein [Bacteroidales bacterium]